MVAANNGGSIKGAWDMSIGYHTADMYDAYVPYLKTILKVENENIIGKCRNSRESLLNGITMDISPEVGYCVVLANGVFVWFESVTGTAPPATTIRFNVDINGRKWPNVYGKDMHKFIVDLDKSYVVPNDTSPIPVQPDENYIKEQCPDNLSSDGTGFVTGYTCGTRILRGDYGTAY